MSCNLEKQIDIDLPNYDSEPFIECYLVPNQPFRLLITQTSSYFENLTLDNPLYSESFLLQGAQVSIFQGINKYELENKLIVDPNTEKIYNYSNSNSVEYNTIDSFYLEILLPNGDQITSASIFLDTVQFDSIVVQFDQNDSLARTLTYFKDFPNETNFYRRVLTVGETFDEPIQDFVTDDLFIDSVFVFGSGYVFNSGDTVFNSVFHLTEDYHNFLESVQQAIDGSGNPFGVPSPLQSNLLGNAQGVFACISESKNKTIIKK
jgi:hypothetical protein